MSRIVLAALAAWMVAGEARAEVQPLTLPAVQSHRLDNGLLVLIYENDQVPLATFKLVAKAGSLLDAPGKEGTADLAARLMSYGTETLSEDDISGTVDHLGATLEAGAGQRSMMLYGNVTTVSPKSLRTFMDLYADVARNPAFRQEALDKVRQQRKGALVSLKEDNASLAAIAMQRVGLEGHPLGRPRGGTPTSLDAIGREDLVDLYRRAFAPEHMVLGVAGDVKASEILAWANERLGGLEWGSNCQPGQSGCKERICVPGKAPQTCERLCILSMCEANPVLSMAAPAERDGLRVVLVDKQDPTLNQVQWQLGAPGVIATGDDDWFAWRLATQVLGGDFTARLNTVLRVKEGLTYGARLSVDHDTYRPGVIAVSTFVKPKDLVRSVELTLAELRGIVTDPIGDEELQSFKSKVIESQPFRFETTGSALDEILNLRLGDLPDAFLAEYPVRLDAVTAEQALGAARRGLPVGGLTLVAVGNADMAEELGKLLPQGGTVEVVPVDALLDPKPR
ncbi:MAG: hypothetical protein AMXMBFR64_40490 [Myxococcales bacterium]